MKTKKQLGSSMRKMATVLAAAGLMTGMAACGNPTASPVPEEAPADEQSADSAPAADGEPILVGASLFTLQYPWFVGAQQGIEQWGEEHPEANVVFQFEDANQNIQTNIQKLEDLAAAGAKGIIVFPVDSKAIIPTMVDLSKNKDIKFVVGDYPQQPDSEDDIVWETFVGHDMVALGEAAGQVAVERLKEIGKDDPTLLFITVPTSGEVSQQRFKGFSDVVLAEFPNARIIEEGDTGAKDRNSAQSLMENVMQREATIDVVAGHNDAEVIGAYNAAVGAGRAADMGFVGIGGDKEILSYISEGNESWIGEVIQDPVILGYTAMEAMWKSLSGETDLPDVYELPKPLAITPDNIAENDWESWEWLG